MVSAPISNMAATSSSAPWFFKLCKRHSQKGVYVWLEGYSLPKAELRRSLPEPIHFLFISGLDELVVDDQERMRRYVLRKRRDS